ncbi:metal ABC transporter permease [Marinomonas sp. A79]|uniref:Metal ABC transporter permease n=1 Tax=Marinomonas vulgaris TaxID=2823372 RepID=A0ABS5HF44_9GAMM|nr:metal ABC transporter permease [Marinomonas vulgaris]
MLTPLAAVAAQWTASMKGMVLITTFTSLLFVGIAMLVSVQLDWPAGLTIIVFAAAMFTDSTLIK